MAPTAQDPPLLNIPESDSAVEVHIINTTSHIKGLPTSRFFEPKIQGFDAMDCPAYSFLIEHPKGKKLLFDLGIRKDWKNLPPAVIGPIKRHGWEISVEKGVDEILEAGGVDPVDINGIIWSHHHWDHTGDPSTFPHTTDLIVGPGFEKSYLPGYPSKGDALISDSSLEKRRLHEVSFANSKLHIGRFRALDWFEDGSFYLLDSPGHTINHLCALCRTTTSPPSFIFLGGDCAHHVGVFRPTSYVPLPDIIPTSSISAGLPPFCPGSLFESFHRLHNKEAPRSESSAAQTTPFFKIAELIAYDQKAAQESVEKMKDFDAHKNILTIIAHDQTLLDVVEMFPQATANEWMKKGWKEKGMWRFLGDFKQAVQEAARQSE